MTVTDITLVRHAQASFGSDNYDQLSELGHRQARWLGHYYAERGIRFDRILVGAQQRHRQTAEGIRETLPGSPELETHSGLNEYDFQALYNCFARQFPEQLNSGHSDRRHLYTILRRGLNAWAREELSDPAMESWGAFNDRVEAAMHCAADTDGGKVLVVSSGGAISMAIKQVLGLDAATAINLNMQTINSAFSTFLVTRSGRHLLNFNSIPHLDTPERRGSITLS